MIRVSEPSCQVILTHLLLPLLHLLSFAFPALIFRADRGGDVARIRLDLLRVRLLEAEVVAPLKVFLLFEEIFPFWFRVVHLVLHHLVVRWDAVCAEKQWQESSDWQWATSKKLKANRNNSREGNKVPFVIFILIEVALVQNIVSQKTLLFIKIWIIPVVPQVFLCKEKLFVILNGNKKIFFLFKWIINCLHLYNH